MQKRLFGKYIIGLYILNFLSLPVLGQSLNLSLVQCGKAKMLKYKGKTLTGVVIEIESKESNNSFILKASSIKAKTLNNKLITPNTMFLAKDDNDIIEGEGIEDNSVWGGEITIGNKSYEAYGSFLRMAIVDLNKGGAMKYSFTKKGIIQIGFIFPEKADNIVEINILNKTIKINGSSNLHAEKNNSDGAGFDEGKISNKFEVKNFNDQILVKVLKGNLKLVNGMTAKTGSNLPVNEEWISFKEGKTLFIVGDGGVVFKGKKYSKGTRLILNTKGAIEDIR